MPAISTTSSATPFSASSPLWRMVSSSQLTVPNFSAPTRTVAVSAAAEAVPNTNAAATRAATALRISVIVFPPKFARAIAAQMPAFTALGVMVSRCLVAGRANPFAGSRRDVPPATVWNRVQCSASGSQPVLSLDLNDTGLSSIHAGVDRSVARQLPY